MRIGVQLPEVERPVRWVEVRDIAIAIEDSGFDSIWTGDHLLYRRSGDAVGPWEAWTSLAAIAEATSRAELGTLVASTSFHNPAMIAKFASTIDEISGGRLILGLGAGWNRVEYDAFGFPFDHRVSRFEEAFTVISTLIRDGSVDFDGTYYTHRGMELVPRARSDMKIMIGSNGPRMLRTALPEADVWNSWFDAFGNRASGLSELMELVDEACLDVGRRPDEIERTVAVYVKLSGGSLREFGGPDHAAVSPISGSREQIAEELRAFDAAGISHIQVILDPIATWAVEELAEIARLIRA
jgi:alkanesulfonate monooxygenase SsuD/methylene tetrahydromethanopterin reductase-like flavin-dependent oxidoreductase (luciferase family)